MNVKFFVLIAAMVVTSRSLAGGQTKLTDPEAATDKLIWDQVYPNGGKTLICGIPFEKKNIRLAADQVYDMGWMKDFLKCGSRLQCLKTPEFQRIASDLINIFPEYKEIARDHQPLQFGRAENVQPKHPELKCAYRSTFSVSEPPDNAKGDIARIIFYMHTEYGLPLRGDLMTLKEWNKSDPPDADEKARDVAIGKAQGHANPFVTNPQLVDSVDK